MGDEAQSRTARDWQGRLGRRQAVRLGNFLSCATRLPSHFWIGLISRPNRSAEPGYLEWVDIDTLHFVGNFPNAAELYGISSSEVRLPVKTISNDLRSNWIDGTIRHLCRNARRVTTRAGLESWR